MTPTVYPNFEKRKLEFLHEAATLRAHRPFGYHLLEAYADIRGNLDALLHRCKRPETAADETALVYGDHPLDPEEVSKHWEEPSDEYKTSQPYHNDLYPF